MFICFFWVKTLQQACIVSAYIYLGFAAYQTFWSIYHLIFIGTHWLNYLLLVVSIISIPINVVLLRGAKQEKIKHILLWLIFSACVLFPSYVLLEGHCVINVQLECIFVNLLFLGLRIYMWFRVYAFYGQLKDIQGPFGPQQFNNPLSAETQATQPVHKELFYQPSV